MRPSLPLAVLLAAALLPAAVAAQTAPAAATDAAAGPAQPPPVTTTLAPVQEPPASERRVLGGHQFLVSHLTEDPFSVTSFASNFVAGTGEALGPRIDLSQTPPNPPTLLADSKWYGYTELAEQIDFTARIVEYVSVHAGLTAGVRQGAGEGSALVVGTTVQVNGVLGVKGSLPVGDTLRLSLSANGSWGPQMNLLILQGIVNAYRSGNFNEADLFQDRKARTLWTTAGAAWGPTPWLGLVANASYLNAQSADISGSTQDGYMLGGSAELDARPLVPRLPLGVIAAYRRTGALGGNGVAKQNAFSGGVYYTGRRDLALGLEIETLRGFLDTELKSKQTVAWVNLRYFW